MFIVKNNRSLIYIQYCYMHGLLTETCFIRLYNLMIIRYVHVYNIFICITVTRFDLNTEVTRS